MSFNITYLPTEGEQIFADLLPNNSSLSKRVRIVEHTKTIILLDKIKIALLLLSDFIWTTETRIEGFFSFETSTGLSQLEIQRLSLFNTLQRILTNDSDASRFAKILLSIAATRIEENFFIIPFDIETSHDYSSVTDQQIANLLQKVVVDNLETAIKLI